MNKPKHTPGPWITELDTTTPNHQTTIRATKENGFTQVCEINRFVDVKLDGANARLIAAAPDMFDLLEQFTKDTLEWDSDTIQEFYLCAEPILEQIRGKK